MSKMTRAEQDVKTTANLYEARRAARFLLGANYANVLRPYRHFIGRVMAVEGLPVLRAALKIGQSIPRSDAIPLMCVMAAAVDMIESPEADDAVDPHVGSTGTPSPREKGKK